jgi:hypothetical protein
MPFFVNFVQYGTPQRADKLAQALSCVGKQLLSKYLRFLCPIDHLPTPILARGLHPEGRYPGAILSGKWRYHAEQTERLFIN